MPGAEWFPGARLNYAEHILGRECPGTDALVHLGEGMPPTGMPWELLAGQVRALATWLREAEVRPGDRVVAWMPNLPQTVVAMLATTAIGAVWAACSPDFGARGALDRFAQLEPEVLIAVDGYRYGGRTYDRREELGQIVAGLPGLRHVITVDGPRAGFLDFEHTHPVVEALHDTLLDIDCSWSPAADGVLRCLPTTSTVHALAISVPHEAEIPETAEERWSCMLCHVWRIGW
jgi:acyl-coenzyme A synthetase/AMP-(fatty) acid ligase